ncbi:MAG TPA: apolipoprotein N-acyltransferase [Verrucomicrobiae bacterium]|nr:apolipoprotein N-acyltransferase [Verrucomicrobiae bacterium]
MIKNLPKGWSRYLLAAIAGLLLAAAFPNLNIAGLAWIAPALMIFAARSARGWQSFRIGYVAGFTFWLASLYWLLLIPVNWYPIMGWLALSAYLAFFSAIWVWLVSRAGRQSITLMQRTTWALGSAAAWVAMEMIRARFLGGFPWNLLGVSQLKILPLVQVASIVGVHGVSFLVVWTSLSLMNAITVILSQPAKRFVWQAEILLPFFTVAMVFAFGMAKLRQEPPAGSTLRVTFVQPSIPQTVIWDPAEDTNRFNQLMALSTKAVAGGTELLLWPEAALPSFDDSNYSAITNLIRVSHVWMVLGADDILPHPTKNNPDEMEYFNAAFLFNPLGEFAGSYHKRNLVIFGEYIPLIKWLPFLKWFTTITGSYAAGDKPVTFQIDRGSDNVITIGDSSGTPPRKRIIKASPLICYEDMFPQLGRSSANDDTDFLVNLTNDGWFGERGEQWQHANAAAFRAIENGLPLLRCCNNGVTCWIDSCGRLQQIFRDEKGTVYGIGAMTADIPLLAAGEKRPRTLFNQYGDWFGWVCVISFCATIFTSTRKKLK